MPDPSSGPSPAECCDVCGAAELEWRKCKQVCRACGSIVRSCADLSADPAEPGREWAQ